MIRDCQHGLLPFSDCLRNKLDNPLIEQKLNEARIGWWRVKGRKGGENLSDKEDNSFITANGR